SHGFANARTAQLWVQYNLAALTARKGGPWPLVVNYADLMNRESNLMSRLKVHLDLGDAPTDEAKIRDVWQQLVGSAVQEPAIADRVVARSPLVPSVVKRLYAFLTEWEAHDDREREVALKEIASSFEDQSLFAGNMVAVALPEPSGVSAP